MFVTEIIQCKLLICNLVHGAARVGHRADFVSVVLLPPVQRGRHIRINHDHAPVFRVLRASFGKAHHQMIVVLAHAKSRFFEGFLAFNRRFLDALYHRTITVQAIMARAIMTVHFVPAIERVPHTTNGVLPTHNLGVFNFNHCASLPSASGTASTSLQQ